MWKYVFKKLITLIPIMFGTTFIVFVVLYYFPPQHSMRLFSSSTIYFIADCDLTHGHAPSVLHLYIWYIMGVFEGDLGFSLITGTPVALEVFARVPFTLQLGLTSLLASLVLAFPIGILAAVRKNTWIDKLIGFIALIGISMPIFALGILLVALFLLPLPAASGRPPLFLLPSTTLGFGMFCAMLRSIRASFLEVIGQDYITSARAKGLFKNKAICKHVLRNSFASSLSAFRTHLGDFFTGIVIVEFLFGRPGIGRFFVQRTLQLDYPMIIACIIIFVLCYFVINLTVDIAQAFIDPRTS